MGCDIHMYVERLDDDGVWRCVAPVRDLERWPIDSKNQGRLGEDWWGPGGCMHPYGCDGVYSKETDENDPCAGSGCPTCDGSRMDLAWWRSRDYELFAILAGVRNYESTFRPIAQPRGIPKDASVPVRRQLEGPDIHTPSWLKVSELLGAGWRSRVIRMSGAIPLQACDVEPTVHWSGPGVDDYVRVVSYQEWRSSGGIPRGYSSESMVASRLLPNHLLSAKRAAEVLDGRADVLEHVASRLREEKFYVSVLWDQTYAQFVPHFVEFVEQLLLPVGPPDRVRIVFGFDN